MAGRATLLARSSSCALFTGLAAAAQAQAPVQFSGAIIVRDLDGGTGTGKLYVGSSPRLRMEFPASGETRATITDPENNTQQTISPGQRTFMELPFGESGGPVRIPKLSMVDPADPCSNGVLGDCMRLGGEMINGFATQKWQYVGVDGDRITAWIATRLRFPVKTVSDNGETTELRNVVERAQPASLFAVPAGFTQVDDVGGSGNAIADALAKINPAMMQQALATAKQMDATNKANPQLPAKAAIWETGAGYVLNFTITMRAAKQVPLNALGNSSQSNILMQYNATIPMNYGTPAVPRGVGPSWSILQLAGSGSRQAEAMPVTMSLEWEEQIQQHRDAGCEGLSAGRHDTSITVKGKAAATASVTVVGSAQALFRINGLITAYDIVGGVSPSSDANIVSTSRTVDHCANDRVMNSTENKKTPVGNLGQLQLEMKDVPLPQTPAGLRGAKTVPLKFDFYEGPANVEWTIRPITAR